VILLGPVRPALGVSLGELLEEIALHAFEGKAPFSAETQEVSEQLKCVYRLRLAAADRHNLHDQGTS
jgi:hypothetical protein